MKIFITSATVYIGNNLAKKLADDGNILHALCRNENTNLLSHSNIKIFKGYITNRLSIEKAMQDCEEVYHLAAHA